MNIKNISAFILIIAVILFGVWYLSSGKTTSQSGLSSLTTTTALPQSGDAQYIYALLQQMASVKLDDSIFHNPAFLKLQDNTVVLASQQAGRDNPFSPVGSFTTVISTPTTPATSTASSTR